MDASSLTWWEWILCSLLFGVAARFLWPPPGKKPFQAPLIRIVPCVVIALLSGVAGIAGVVRYLHSSLAITWWEWILCSILFEVARRIFGPPRESSDQPPVIRVLLGVVFGLLRWVAATIGVVSYPRSPIGR